ncbi:MAG: putative GTP-binding protein YjiA [Alphaproteobacteria bacterium MarineAlpha4_Bin2]|nr:MAG: putative GTP-binding protein YjiA [Alphaproteobacteria bacterium MarineAlpha4_Bin2]
MDLIPATLLTGFLGSGKSTLLTQILHDPKFSDTAVVVNEFGEVGLDGFLVEHTDDQIVEMTTGCLCCTIRGDIRDTLLMLYSRQDKGEIPKFRRLVVESTGLADPAPVIHTLMSDPWLDRRYMLGGIVATIDAVNGIETLDTHSECMKQAAVADRLVITKADLIDKRPHSKELGPLKTKLHTLNPSAPILVRHDPAFTIDHLFDTSLYDPETKTIDVRGWLNTEAGSDEGNHHTHKHHNNFNLDGQDPHDVTRHGRDIRSFVLTFDNPIVTETFLSALEALTSTQGANLLRLKGIIHTTEHPSRPLVIHGVQHVFHDPIWLDAWPDADKRTRLIFITRHIERATLKNYFEKWMGAEQEH